MLSVGLFVLLLDKILATLVYTITPPPMIMYVGLLGHFAVVFHVLLFVWLFYQWHHIDLFSCIAASLFNKLT